MKPTVMHKGRPERNDLSLLIESDVRYRVGDWDSVDLLLDIRMPGTCAIEGRVKVDVMRLEVETMLNESNRGFL